MYNKPYIIAEIGCNHKGNISIAKEMIETVAVFCKADAIKFQKRCTKELLTSEQYNAPHPNPIHSYGTTYGEHRDYLEFSLEQHAVLKEWCENLGVVYSASVWDLTSAKEIASLKPLFIKIPSACNTNYEMLQWLCNNYIGEIQISLGMTTHEEEVHIIELFEKNKRNKDLVIFNCVSGYPVSFEDLSLLEIQRLSELYGKRIKKIGFSGHHLGIAIDISAYTLGAEIIERHFTMDRTWKGTDHAASLEPDGLRKLVRNLEASYKALTYKKEEILQIEKIQREKLKYNRR